MTECIKVNGKWLSEEESAAWAAEKAKKNKNMFAELAAEGRGIGINGSDNAYLAGFGANGKQFEKCPMLGDWTKEMKPGYSPGAVYVSGVNRWVHTRSDIKRICEQENKSCIGAVEHQAEPMPPPKPIPLAEDSIRDHMKRYAKRDPACADTPAKRKKLREAVIARHGAQ